MGGGAEAGFKALLIRTNPSEPPMYMLPSLATNAGLAKKSLGNMPSIFIVDDKMIFMWIISVYDSQ